MNKTLIIILGLMITNLSFAYPIECRNTIAECRVDRWNKNQECIALEFPFYEKTYGTDLVKCTEKAMLEYNIAARLKLGYSESIKSVTKSADLPYDERFDWATATPIGGVEINSEGGSIPIGLLVILGSILAAILGWFGYKKLKK